MGLFLLIFLTIYTGMHALVFWGVHPLLKGHPALPTLTGGWMVLMIIAPLLVRLSERSGLEGLARALAWVGYSWMGGVFLAFSCFLLVGCWDLLALLGRWLLPQLPNLSLHGAVTSVLVLLVVSVASFYGFYEANNLQIEHLRIATPKLPPGATPIRVVQISDLHLGLIHRDETLAPIVNRLRELEPDLLVATGDTKHISKNWLLWN